MLFRSFARAADNLDRVAKQATGFRRESAARLLEQGTVTPEELVRQLRELAEPGAARSQMQAALMKWHAPNAAAEIAEHILKCLNGATVVAPEVGAIKHNPGFVA